MYFLNKAGNSFERKIPVRLKDEILQAKKRRRHQKFRLIFANKDHLSVYLSKFDRKSHAKRGCARGKKLQQLALIFGMQVPSALLVLEQVFRSTALCVLSGVGLQLLQAYVFRYSKVNVPGQVLKDRNNSAQLLFYGHDKIYYYLHSSE